MHRVLPTLFLHFGSCFTASIHNLKDTFTKINMVFKNLSNGITPAVHRMRIGGVFYPIQFLI